MGSTPKAAFQSVPVVVCPAGRWQAVMGAGKCLSGCSVEASKWSYAHPLIDAIPRRLHGGSPVKSRTSK